MWQRMTVMKLRVVPKSTMIPGKCSPVFTASVLYNWSHHGNSFNCSVDAYCKILDKVEALCNVNGDAVT